MRHLIAGLSLLATPLQAEPVAVVTDIAPVAALVAEVQAGRGTVAALLGSDADPHNVTLRPSEARALQSAGLIVWIGPELTPWMATALDRLAPGAPRLGLLDLAVTQRQARADEGHGHEDGREDGRGFDPHAWLDPDNAAGWLPLVAEALADADPDGAAHYRARARAAARELQAIAGPSVAAGTVYLAEHDSLAYAEAALGMTFAGALSDADGQAPGAAHLAELVERAGDTGAGCLVHERARPGPAARQFAADLGLTLVAVDILGAEIAPGGYVAWFARLGTDLGACP